MRLSKTDFLIYRNCARNAWLKIHRPDLYHSKPLSEFDQALFDTGNDVDELARGLFPGGILVTGDDSVDVTLEHIANRTPVLYQPVFEAGKYKAISDVLVWNPEAEAYDLYEVKASNSGKDKSSRDRDYAYDLAFQKIVLQSQGVPLNTTYLVRLNCDYVRNNELDLNLLFTQEDFTEKVDELIPELSAEMETAFKYLYESDEPTIGCQCIFRGRSAHCTTFDISNPHVPEYSVHDISRIGLSKKKLADLISQEILHITEVPEDFGLSDKQQSQIRIAKSGEPFVSRDGIRAFLSAANYPISFLDYETHPAGIPRFSGYGPFGQIPFQFSLDVLESPGGELRHEEFLFTDTTAPDLPFIQALRTALPETGSVVVWSKKFECSINTALAERNPEYASFLEGLNARIIDLEDIFTGQHHVHPGFKGKTSIKYILPALVPQLSYDDLDIKSGTSALQAWDKIVSGSLTEEEIQATRQHLLAYCGRDSYAMYAIWEVLERAVA